MYVNSSKNRNLGLHGLRMSVTGTATVQVALCVKNSWNNTLLSHVKNLHSTSCQNLRARASLRVGLYNHGIQYGPSPPTSSA